MVCVACKQVIVMYIIIIPTVFIIIFLFACLQSVSHLIQTITNWLQKFGNDSYPTEYYEEMARGIVDYEKSLAKVIGG